MCFFAKVVISVYSTVLNNAGFPILHDYFLAVLAVRLFKYPKLRSVWGGYCRLNTPI